jgi:hypothetical protein
VGVNHLPAGIARAAIARGLELLVRLVTTWQTAAGAALARAILAVDATHPEPAEQPSSPTEAPAPDRASLEAQLRALHEASEAAEETPSDTGSAWFAISCLLCGAVNVLDNWPGPVGEDIVRAALDFDEKASRALDPVSQAPRRGDVEESVRDVEEGVADARAAFVLAWMCGEDLSRPKDKQIHPEPDVMLREAAADFHRALAVIDSDLYTIKRALADGRPL